MQDPLLAGADGSDRGSSPRPSDVSPRSSSSLFDGSHFSCGKLCDGIMPILSWGPSYDVKTCLSGDLTGGLTLGFILMGQSLAHAALCKVSLIHGPYSCMLPPLIYAIFGTSHQGSVGTGGLISLIAGLQLESYGDSVEVRTRAGAILTLLTGIGLMLMGICRLSAMVRLMSRPALSGFVTGSAILIILSQITPMIGIPDEKAGGGIVSVVLRHPEDLQYVHIATSLLSLVVMLILFNAKALKKIPFLSSVVSFKEMALFAITSAFTYFYNASANHSTKIDVVGSMPSGLPGFSMPVQTASDLHLAKEMIPAALLLALVVFISSFAGAKKFAMEDGYQVSAFNELIALGLGSVAGSFNGSVPIQVGLSRMGIARAAGVKTQFGANIVVACVVAAIVQAFSPYLYYIPICVLNCIIINGASHLLDFNEAVVLFRLAKNPRYAFKCRMDILTWSCGFIATLVLGAFQGMLCAVVLSMGLTLFLVVNPDITELGALPLEKGQKNRTWITTKARSTKVEDGILVFRIEGPLFFANVDSLQEWLEEKELSHVAETGETYEGVVLSATAISFIDTTAIQVLKDITEHYQARNVFFFMAGTLGTVNRMVKDHLLEQQLIKLDDEVKQDVRRMQGAVDEYIELIRSHSSTHRAPFRRSVAATASERDLVRSRRKSLLTRSQSVL